MTQFFGPSTPFRSVAIRFLFVWFIALSCRSSPGQEVRQIDGAPRYFRDVAAAAKLAGNTSVKLEPDSATPTGVNSLANVLGNYSIIVAQPVSMEITLSEPRAVTKWYKLRITETISKQEAVPSEPMPDNVPPDLKNLRVGDLVLAQSGGEVLVDGVHISKRAREGFELNTSQRYLLIVYIQASGQFAEFAAGPGSAYVVNDKDQDQITSVSDVSTRFSEEIRDIYHNRLSVIRKESRRDSNR